ncbi:MAG TPA: LysR substrate-binding domain-containing protein [Nocardioides sp.]|nr:LysR substrate-binding domain-containing protein [Nocardioides sp.]
MLDVRRLKLLRDLSVHGTLAAVAEVLHQSPSSVSQQLSVLEQEARTPLLRKAGRRVELTAAGILLAEYAEQILALIDEAEASVARSGDEVVGTVHVAAFQSAALAFMPQLLARLAADHPRLEVTMSQRLPEDALLEARARSNGLDLVIAQQYPHHPAPLLAGLDREPLTRDRLRLAVPPAGDPWDRIVDLADAADAPWAMEPRGAASRAWVEHACREAGFEPRIRFETDDLEAHIALVESGNAVVILPELMCVRRPPRVRWIDLPGQPRREVFTSTRAAMASAPPIAACRAALAGIVPAELEVAG